MRVGSIQVYLSSINDEIRELKRFKAWAQPIFKSNFTDNIHVHGHGVQTPVKQETVIDGNDKGGGKRTPVKRKSRCSDSNMQCKFQVREVVQAVPHVEWNMHRQNGKLVGMSPPPL